MSMVINTNVASIGAQRHISMAVREQSEAMERLASGKRINGARDDAAGLGISNSMTSQIRGLDQGVRNANDGISLIQTAEGALGQTTSILQRMRELSIQSANGTYNDSENRASLNAEMEQLLDEIDRISETTQFNGINILDGSMDEIALQIGADASQTVEFGIDDMGAKSLGMGSNSFDLVGDESKTTWDVFFSSFKGVSIGHDSVLINGQSIIEAGGSAINSASSKDTIIDAINGNVSGVSASLIGELRLGLHGNGILTGTETLSIILTMPDDSQVTYEVRDTQNFEEIATKLNETSNGALSASISNGELVVTADDVSMISTSNGPLSLIPLAQDRDKSAGSMLALTSDNNDPITIERGTNGTYEDLTALGFRESSEAGTIEGYGITAPSTAWGYGDVTINGVVIDENTTAGSLISKVDAINAVSDQTGVTAETFVTAEIDMSAVAFYSATSFIINGFTATSSHALSANSTLKDIVLDVNNMTNLTGIKATLSGETIQLEGNTSSLIILGSTAGSTGLEDASLRYTKGGLVVTATSQLSADAIQSSNIETIYGGFKLISENNNPITIDLSTAASISEHGLKKSNTAPEGTYGSSINNISIDTAAKAQKAIDSIDNAIKDVNNQRGQLGAINNRLEYTIDNLQNVSQQTAAARSRIVDADFAGESAALSRSQVIQQAGTAMLAQANSAPQQVLQLLR
jgi:flagellin